MTSVRLEPEIFVWGTTPAGIMAAVSAARAGRRVLIADYSRRVGGMSASGLSKSDVQNRGAVRGLFLEFTQRVKGYYERTFGSDSEQLRLSQEGYYYEPRIAEMVFREMLEESEGIETLLRNRLLSVDRLPAERWRIGLEGVDERVESAVEAGILIDASYEGDLYAAAGAGYRTGREGREEYGEPHAGRIFLDYESFDVLQGSTGAGDDRLQAYTYRLCLTDDPSNSVPMQDPPPGYDRSRYLAYLEDLKEGRLGPPRVFREGHGYYAPHFDTIMRAFSFTPIPNGKYDVNINPRPLAFPFPEENIGYAEANWEERERISRRHKELALGLLYFAQNDPAVPEKQRALARQYHLPKDEFEDNGHFPWQLYVREARRLEGLYTITELDAALAPGGQRTKIHPDTVATGEFPIDSFPVTKEPSSGREVLEGYIGVLEAATNPYQIPLRALLPADIHGLLVPVAASASHVAFSTLRMEPLWMALGQAAGVAADLALEAGCDPRELPLSLLQQRLLDGGEVLSYFRDLSPARADYAAVQFWAARGFFGSYSASPDEPVTKSLLECWLQRAHEFFESRPRAGEIGEPCSPVDERDIDGREIGRNELEGTVRARFPLAFDGDGGDGNSNPTARVTRGELCLELYRLVRHFS